jgi:hypothetical protein
LELRGNSNCSAAELALLPTPGWPAFAGTRFASPPWPVYVQTASVLSASVTVEISSSRRNLSECLEAPFPAGDADAEACALPPELLARVDENLWCRAVNDNPDLPIDLSAALLFQTPAATEIQRRLAHLESAAFPSPPTWLPALTAMVDALFRHLVETLAMRPPEAGLSAPPHVIDVLNRLAGTLAALSEENAAGSTTRAGCPPGRDACASS